MPALNMVGCTIVAGNFRAYAEVLADDWRRCHGDAPFHTLLIDEDSDDPDRSDIIPATALGLPPGDLAQMRGIYGVAELTTALKPHLLRMLLDACADAVVFVDADNDLHADLHEAGSLAAQHGIALTPHMLDPPPLDGRSPSEPEIAWHGLFNSGFVAVGQSGRPFLDWWASRLRWDCLFCEPAGLHADQKWLDLAPVYFRPHVLRDPGINVAHWNVHERPVRYDGTSYTAAGRPLRTFHFSGFEGDALERVRPGIWPRPLRYRMEELPDLRRLNREYAEKLAAAGHAEFRTLPYRYGVSASGRPLGSWERHAYREILLAAGGRGDAGVPHPFDPARAGELDLMLDEPGAAGLSEAALARLRDAHLKEPVMRGDGWDAVRGTVRRARQIPRRVPGRRLPWMPYPLHSDRTRLEYTGEEGA